MKPIIKHLIPAIIFALFFTFTAPATQTPAAHPLASHLLEEIPTLMEEADIPGMCVVVARKGAPPIIRGFGLRNVERRLGVDGETIFQLGSCSKSFTALAVLTLEASGKIDLDAPLEQYLPWFRATTKGKRAVIRLKHLLHHSSGIPWETVGSVPVGNHRQSLEDYVRSLSGLELNHTPGRQFLYASANYDILGLVIETVSGKSFKEYLETEILTPLGLTHTKVGANIINPNGNGNIAAGYKIGFFTPLRYRSPVLRANNPAAYIVSNGADLARWLELWLYKKEAKGKWPAILQRAIQPDLSVQPHGEPPSSYAGGWIVNLYQEKTVRHEGLNPNFSSFVGFKPEFGVGVAVLANSNSLHTAEIGDYLLDRLSGKERIITDAQPEGLDSGFSLTALFIALFVIGILGFWGMVIGGVIRRNRRFALPDRRKILNFGLSLLCVLPFAAAIYVIPSALAGFDWQAALVWAPASLPVAVGLAGLAIILTYGGYLFSLLFPHRNRYMRSLPLLVLLGFFTGLANMLVIFIISRALGQTMKPVYTAYYFALVFLIYIIGTKIVETRLIKLSLDVIYDLRMTLFRRIFTAPYQSFENIEHGRLLATLNDDTHQMGASAGVVIHLATSVITVVAAFVYLACIAFWATAVTIVVVAAIAILYSYVSNKAEYYFEAARDTRNVFMKLLNGLVSGYRELALHRGKSSAYQQEAEACTGELRSTLTIARVKFIDAFLVGESLLVIVLGTVAIGFPHLFPGISDSVLVGFIMVLLYLIGPINAILNAVPQVMELKVSYNRVKQFLKEIPETGTRLPEKTNSRLNHIDSIEARNLHFKYKSLDGEPGFAVGPIDFRLSRGEIFFVVGGNGSGKSTLGHLLTGLYVPAEGSVKINGNEIEAENLGEYFSVVFSDFFLFETLYDVDVQSKKQEIQEYLELLRLDEKVRVNGNAFSTVDLSGGQKKRLALLKCYLEDRPIFLLDEVAADQDPEFRKFFYHTLLPRMKGQGKIIIAITHDDHYFDVADHIIKLDMGKIDTLKEK
jgi:cyclic peptide transporter